LVTYEARDGLSRRAGEQRQAELGEFLKARRAQLSPGDFGLPRGSRRRTPGLRREEVALLAGVGVTWYTWLEQGRQINASTQVLDPVARTLRLDRVEREHLYRLAEATPLRSAYSRYLGDQDWEEDIRRLASLSREFAELWARHEVADPEPRRLTYLHPDAGVLSLAVSELNVPDMPDARIMVYTPHDDETRAKMPLTRRTERVAAAVI
jgi:transcriptional regulator with XRE-family HTH domain